MTQTQTPAARLLAQVADDERMAADIDALTTENADLKARLAAADRLANEIHKLRFDEESIELRRQVFRLERAYRATQQSATEGGGE